MRPEETKRQETAGWGAIVISAVGTAILLGLCVYLADFEPLKEWTGMVLKIMLPWLAIVGVTYLILRLFGIRPAFGKNRK